MSLSPAWSPLALPGPVGALAAHDATAVASLHDGRLARSTDGGATWSVLAARAPGATALLDLGDAVLAGSFDGIVRAESSADWAARAPVPTGVAVTALAGRAAATIAGTRRAGVFRSADGGLAWEASGDGLPLGGARLPIYAASAGDAGLVVAHALGVSRSLDGGRSWHSAGVGLPFQIPDAAVATGGRSVFASVGGRVYRATPDAGDAVLAWSEAYDGPAAGRPLGLLGSDDGAVYAATHAPPYLVRSSDGGATWRAVRAGLPDVPVGLATGEPWLLAVLADGTVWRARRPAASRHRASVAGPLRVTGMPDPATICIGFALRVPARVAVTLHDLHDAEVATVARGRFAAGEHLVGLTAPYLQPGLYRCRLRAGAESRSAPLVLALDPPPAPGLA